MRTELRVVLAIRARVARRRAGITGFSDAQALQFVEGFQGLPRAEGVRVDPGQGAEHRMAGQLGLIRGQAGEQVGLGAGGDLPVLQLSLIHI